VLEALRDLHSHPERLAVAESDVVVTRILRATWGFDSSPEDGPALDVDEARGDLGPLAVELLAAKPESPAPEAIAAVSTPTVRFLIVDTASRPLRPPMPEPDWYGWSPSAESLAAAGMVYLGQIPALTPDEWKERLRPAPRSAPLP
jgi:hypothetical protein